MQSTNTWQIFLRTVRALRVATSCAWFAASAKPASSLHQESGDPYIWSKQKQRTPPGHHPASERNKVFQTLHYCLAANPPGATLTGGCLLESLMVCWIHWWTWKVEVVFVWIGSFKLSLHGGTACKNAMSDHVRWPTSCIQQRNLKAAVRGGHLLHEMIVKTHQRLVKHLSGWPSLSGKRWRHPACYAGPVVVLR